MMQAPQTGTLEVNECGGHKVRPPSSTRWRGVGAFHKSVIPVCVVLSHLPSVLVIFPRQRGVRIVYTLSGRTKLT